jgi:GntR family transcriptional regulator
MSAVLRDAILRGDYAPGALLPKGEDLASDHGVSRAVIYRALAGLAAEGLVSSVRRGGTRVRELADVALIARDRGVLADERGYYFDAAAKYWTSPRPTRVSRQPAPADIARILGTGAADVVRRDRAVGPAAAAAAQLAISHIPAGVGDALALGGESTGPGGIYARLEDARWRLSWTERVGARMPSPGEASELQCPAGVPMLRVLRVTTGRRGRERAVLEVCEILARSDRYAVTYQLRR